MPNEKDEWFVIERSEALAGLLLTSRKDVKIRDKQVKDNGVDFLVDVHGGDLPSMRLFMVQVKGTTSFEYGKWMTSLQHLIRSKHGHFSMPACAFIVNVSDNRAMYSWVAKPSVEGQSAHLSFLTRPELHELTIDAIDEIIRNVNAWYDVLPKQLYSE